MSEQNKAIIMGVDYGDHIAFGHSKGFLYGRKHIENLIDELVIIIEHRRFGYDDWQEHSQKVYRNAQKEGINVCIQVSTESRIDEMKNPPAALPISIVNNREMFLDIEKNAITQCLGTTADGIFMYEAAEVEAHNYWEAVLQGVKQYKNSKERKGK